MHQPPLVGWLLVVLCTATGAYCLGGVRAGGVGERRAARGDALMALGMAVMALPVWMSGAPSWGAALFAAVFAAAGLRALSLVRRQGGGHHLHHAIGAFAMVYMALAMAAAPEGGHGGHTGHRPAGAPPLTGLLLLYFAVYVVRSVPALLPAAVTPGAVAAPVPARRPELTRACRLSMGIGMVTMLLTM
ncbi:DUF5134 domain-containing protein [Streptomyces orinoci]|uniref:DUF5134 domain-containing protein n=1 Tax=Streptomyces orinoci TaxID=67339 RepID=A0ABV3K0E1_STRON|nr:DUF5134 domain-containing protein [Streptomyces orinoci]